jgi:hypothetical protein
LFEFEFLQQQSGAAADTNMKMVGQPTLTQKGASDDDHKERRLQRKMTIVEAQAGSYFVQKQRLQVLFCHLIVQHFVFVFHRCHATQFWNICAH